MDKKNALLVQITNQKDVNVLAHCSRDGKENVFVSRRAILWLKAYIGIDFKCGTYVFNLTPILWFAILPLPIFFKLPSSGHLRNTIA